MKSEQISIAERIEELEAVEQIRKLMGTYCHSIDSREKETFLSIWDKEAFYEVTLGTGIGLDEIANMYDIIANDAQQHHHHNTNIVIHVDGNTAAARSDVFFYRLDSQGKPFLLSGKYEDEFRKSSGKWLFVKRKFTKLVGDSPKF